jgi:hypothetical protein
VLLLLPVLAAAAAVAERDGGNFGQLVAPWQPWVAVRAFMEHHIREDKTPAPGFFHLPGPGRKKEANPHISTVEDASLKHGPTPESGAEILTSNATRGWSFYLIS